MVNNQHHDVQCFIDELSSRVAAQTGIATDRFHLGKIILQSFKDAPEFIMQIDGATGDKDTFKSALDRSIRCALAMRNFGIKTNDVIALMGPNCLDLPITLYAGFYLGVGVSTYNMSYNITEFQDLFLQCAPKLVFCTSASATTVEKSLEAIDVEALIITFDETDSFMSFQQFLHKYSDEKQIKEFKPNEFDPSETDAIITTTSGTTGLPKLVPLTHANIVYGFPCVGNNLKQYPTPTRLGLCISPVQWLTSHFTFVLSPITRFTRLQTSLPATVEHVSHLIKVYKPSFAIVSPTFMTKLLNRKDFDQNDFACFECIVMGGSVVAKELVDKFKTLIPSGSVYQSYGMTEATGLIFTSDDKSGMSCGSPLQYLKYRLVDPETNIDVFVPNQPGELWVKGPTVFKGYYNKPETNADTFSGEWLKTGDLFYRDEHDYYYFVDRIKMLLKYKSHQISPAEIEKVLIGLSTVSDVAVTGISDPEGGDLPVACVVPRKGCNVSAEEIKDFVNSMFRRFHFTRDAYDTNQLSDAKRLRGGVIFLQELPLTPSGKVNRKALKLLAKTAKRL